tara:strand:- start:70 stop:552 length:483 start_codon:yes stop_codon:yes gene_type:complete
MSKKSRKRNRKILGALAAGLGAMALMKGRNRGAVSTAGQPVGVNRMDPDAVTGTEYPGSNKAVVADTAESKPIIPRGAGHPIIRGNTKRYAKAIADANTPGMGTAVAPPSILNPYRTQRQGKGPRRFSTGGRVSHNSGGKVKGCGIAKRGLGRAMKKGRK